MFNNLRKRKYRDYEINPDEIFLDTLNVSELNQQQFEGVIERPIKPKVLVAVGLFFLCVGLFFVVRLYNLQIIQGDQFTQWAENNRLKNIPIFAERGVIYDRNGVELAWNVPGTESEPFLYRKYTSLTGHGHLLGYVQYPQTDSRGNYWRTEVSGLAGVESKYNKLLSGVNGVQLREVNALGEITSENTIQPSKAGANLDTTVDAEVQHALFEAIRNQAEKNKFVGGAGSIMNVHTGEMIAFTSYPEFDPYTLAEGKDVEKIKSFFSDKGKPFLNRLINGVYSPGSIVKPFLALGALNEGLITENTKILSTGRIEIPNRFNPANASYFRDWRRTGHGLTDVRHAIADSVNTFFYAIGGGYKDQKGLGISGIEKYIRAFNIAEKTGIEFGDESVGTIPNPEWKARTFSDGVWRLGDTYNTSIGQFGFQVTPLQMTRATAALANGGVLFEPLLVKQNPIASPVSENISQDNYELIRTAMRDTVTKGTAKNIDVSYLQIAAKTGTAQVGKDNEFYNSWVIGFFPYENPQYAFSIVMERGPKGGLGSAARTMREFLDSLHESYPIFFDNIKNKSQE